ncbi:MAG: FixH family protein [Saprospiraceae bacterium]
MKINWGTGITLFYSLFMVTMIYMVYQSTQTNRNLVVENYYEKDLQYQNHLNKISNSQHLKTNLNIQKNGMENRIEFSFPKEIKNVTGEILFYRPSDNSQDKTANIQLDQNHIFHFSTIHLQKGNWKVKVDWIGDGTAFYKEVNIQI